MSKIACSTCHQVYPSDRIPFQCECGGCYDYVEFPHFSPAKEGSFLGMSRYAHLMDVHPGDSLISLGEGSTPLLSGTIGNLKVHLKMECMNPTGSYKDRGTFSLVNTLQSKGVTFAIEDSSGNAGASFAAYCARAGIKARVYVPESASGPKRTQIERYGAELVSVPGPRAEASKAALMDAQTGAVYASHAWMPFGLPGIATIAYEIVEQLGKSPGVIVVPVGHGGLLYGMMRGFQSMVEAGYIKHEPYYLGVQASGCAPVFDAYARRSTETREVDLSESSAEGVKVTHPVRGKAILEKLVDGQGSIVSVQEKELVNAWCESARKGIFMEPTSALVWAAISNFPIDFKAPVVAVISGSGYKSNILQKME